MHHLIVVDEDLAASRRRLRVAVMLSLTEKTSWKVEDTGYSVILKNKKVKSGGVKFGKWACVGLYVSRLVLYSTAKGKVSVGKTALLCRIDRSSCGDILFTTRIALKEG
jgi:hypothetical protein